MVLGYSVLETVYNLKVILIFSHTFNFLIQLCLRGIIKKKSEPIITTELKNVLMGQGFNDISHPARDFWGLRCAASKFPLTGTGSLTPCPGVIRTTGIPHVPPAVLSSKVGNRFLRLSRLSGLNFS